MLCYLVLKLFVLPLQILYLSSTSSHHSQVLRSYRGLVLGMVLLLLLLLLLDNTSQCITHCLEIILYLVPSLLHSRSICSCIGSTHLIVDWGFARSLLSLSLM